VTLSGVLANKNRGRSLSKLKKDTSTQWTDVRNYEARNFLKSMKKGDELLVYHSNADPSGIAGLAIVAKEAYPDPGQFDKRSEYFDEKSTRAAPRWFAPDVKFKAEFKELISLDLLRKRKELSEMALFKRSRLSVQPVSEREFQLILKLSKYSDCP
jgi:predicted RNA-binding protein with PUA-like domain